MSRSRRTSLRQRFVLPQAERTGGSLPGFARPELCSLRCLGSFGLMTLTGNHFVPAESGLKRKRLELGKPDTYPHLRSCSGSPMRSKECIESRNRRLNIGPNAGRHGESSDCWTMADWPWIGNLRLPTDSIDFRCPSRTCFPPNLGPT